jgi:hypothetical protein
MKGAACQEIVGEVRKLTRARTEPVWSTPGRDVIQGSPDSLG